MLNGAMTLNITTHNIMPHHPSKMRVEKYVSFVIGASGQ
jgi:hypothetical protein